MKNKTSFLTGNYKVIPPLFFLYLMPSIAFAFQWPVLDDVEVEITGTSSATYKGNWSTLEIDDQSDGNGFQYIGIIHRHVRASDQMLVTGAMARSLRVTSADCPGYLFSCIGKKWIQENGANGSYTLQHTGGPNGNECVGISSLNTKDEAAWVSARQPVSPATACLGTPPANQWCAMITPSIEFNYGNLSLTDAAGSQMSKPVQIECTDDIDYVLRLRGISYITLSNGMIANITTDGNQPLGQTLHGDQGQNTVNITSTLEGDVQPGYFSGQGILFVSYP